MEAGVFPGEPQATQLLEQLEREGRYPELASELGARASSAHGAERGALYARLAEVLLRMADIPRALVALKESLDSDPQQPASRRWLEVLLAEPDHALEAAEALQPIYEREFRTVPHSASMLLAILELKANRCSDQDERIAIWVELAANFDLAATPPERAREIAVRLLVRTALEWPGGVAKWIDRVMRLVVEPEERLRALTTALEQPLSDPLTVSELSLAAGHVLEELGRGAEARPLYERALVADATSPEVLSRIDELAHAANEDPQARAARFRAAIDATRDPERGAALRIAFGLLQKNVLDDLEAAQTTLREAVREAPGSFRAHEALLEVYGALQDDSAVEQELERGLTLFSGLQRRRTLTRLGDQLLTRGRALEALSRARPLLDEPEVDEAALDFVERLAEEASDLEVWRRVHERRVDIAPDRAARLHVLERLGDFLNERAGDRAAAVIVWKTAAELAAQGAESTAEPERFYQRVLAISPEDGQASRRLVELCAQGDDWQSLPNALRVLLEATNDALGAAELVLALEGRAIQLGVADQFASVADDVVSRLEDDREAETRALVSAKARVMASAGRYDEAAHVYEALIESFADEQDVRAFVGLVESSSEPSWRHAKRCWLFEWRAGRAEDPIAVLTHWATVEEQEFGDPAAALVLLERAAALDGKRAAIFREMARLRQASGDFNGRFDALARLRAALPAGEAAAEELGMAELLIERLDRPSEALPLLGAVLRAEPGSERARELALRLCHSTATVASAAALLEQTSREHSEDLQRVTLRAVLEASEPLARESEAGKELAPLRRRWFERLVALESGDAALAVFERAAAEFPKDEAIWAAVETGAVRAGKADAAVRAYEMALLRTEDAELAEALGRRLVTFADEHVGSLRSLTASLERMLVLAPGARWAFQRVKLALTNEQRWDDLFALYERVIDSAKEEGERATLLDEAAVVARDLASDPDRAIGYWEGYFALRADDARVDVALERLYERQQRLPSLISHLSARESRLHDDELVRLRERIAGLWLDVGKAASALAVIESLPKSAASADGTLALLERVFAVPASDADERKVKRRAAKLLKQRYQGLERPRDVAEVLVKELVDVSEQKERIKLLSALGELRQRLTDEAAEFETLGELMLLEPHQEKHRARLAELAHELDNRARFADLIVLTAERVPEEPLFARLLGEAASIRLELGERERAVEIFARVLAEATDDEARLVAAHRLEALLSEVARPSERVGVLERIAALAKAPEERRKALLEAARVALDELREPERAAAAYRLLLEREPKDVALLDGLLRALRAGERWGDVVAALATRAELEPEPAISRQNLGEAALLRAERLGDIAGAISAWLGIRERFGRDEESFQRLSTLFEGAGRYGDLARLLDEEAEHSPAPTALYARLAEVHRSHTGDFAAAFAAYLNAGILVSAAELFCAHAELVPDEPARALELSGRLTNAGQTEVAERVLRRQLEHYGPRRPKDGVAVHLALAELLVGAAQAPRGLAELVVAAERYPENDRVLAAFGELAFELGDLERAEQSYRALLLVLGRDPDAGKPARSRAEVYLAMSQVAAARGESERAEDHIAAAFEAALGNEQEAHALEQALHELGRTDLAERAITARLERARDPSRVATALSDLVQFSLAAGPMDPALTERALRLAERSARDLESAGGSDTQAWQALRNVFELLGEKERATRALEALAARASNEGERLDYEFAIAERLLELPEHREAALARLWSIVRRDAALEQPYRTLLSLISTGPELDQLLEILKSQAAAANAAGDGARLHLLVERLAIALEQAGRLREALEAQAILGEHAATPQALAKIVELHERLGTQGAELADALEALLVHESDAERARELGLRLVELRRLEWDEEGVERALELAFERAPAHAELAEPLLMLLLERGATPRAIEVLQRRIEHAPREPGLRLRLADAFSRAKEPERALSALEAALGAGAPEAAVRRERARILESLGRADDALGELDAAISAEGGAPNELLAAIERTNAFEASERWALRAADLFAESGQRAKARQILEPWLARLPENAALLTRVGRWANIDKDYSTALSAYRTLCRVEHGSAKRSAVLALARVAESAGRAEEAVAEVEAALAEGLESAELRRELGRLYARTGARLKQGRILLEEARAAKAGAQLELFSKAAELLAAEGATDEALAALEEVQKLDPERADVALISATVLAAGGRSAEARTVLEQALAASEKRRGKPQAKLLQKLAELALAEDELVEAFDALGQAFQLDKADAEIALTLGLLAADLDQGELAFNALRAFITLKEKSIDTPSRRQLSRAYTQLGELELGKGQRTVAKRMATRAIETDPENKSAQRLLTDLGHR
jgi:tetratricopeptide (TPR) repeat protein